MSEVNLVWSGNEIELSTAISSAELMTSVARLNLQNKEFHLHLYRGFTSLSAIDRTDNDYSIMAKMGIFQTPVDFIKHKSPDGGMKSEFLDASFVSHEVAIIAFCNFVDKYYSIIDDVSDVADS